MKVTRIGIAGLVLALTVGLWPGLGMAGGTGQVYGAAGASQGKRAGNQSQRAEQLDGTTTLPLRKTTTADVRAAQQPAAGGDQAARASRNIAGNGGNSNLPAAYDLRKENLVTPVRDQGDWSACWAFASLGALESNVLMQQKQAGRDTEAASKTLDLSEMQLMYNGSRAIGSTDTIRGYRVKGSQWGRT